MSGKVFWFYFLTFIWVSSTLFAQKTQDIYPYKIQKDIESQGIDLTSYVSYLEDTSDLNIYDLLSNKTDFFVALESQKEPLKSNGTYWGRLSITNELSSITNTVLSFGENNFATLYVVKNGEVIHEYLSGELVKASKKTLASGRKESLFDISLSPNETMMCYFKVHNITHFPPQIVPRLFNKTQWNKGVKSKILIDGLYQGFLWFLICYSLAFYIKIKDKTYLYFALYVFCFAVYFSWYKGLLHEFVLTESPYFNIHLWLVSGLMPVFYLLFLRNFLSTNHLVPTYDKWIKRVVIFDLLVFLLSAVLFYFTFNRPQSVSIINNTSLINLILGIGFCYLLLKTKNILVNYFVLGSLIFASSAILSIVSYGYFEYQNATYFLMAGNTLELTIFSLGLAKRVEMLRKEKKEADAKLIAQLKQNELLQEEVKSALAQTIDEQENELLLKNQELSKAVERLRGINDELQSFAYTVSHDLKAPLRAVNYFANFIGEDKDHPLKEEDQKNLELLKSQVSKMDALIQGVLKYSIAASLVRESKSIDLNAIMAEISEVTDSSSQIRITYDELPVVNGDEVKLHQVFQNLIANSLKNIDPERGTIHVSAKENENDWVISVEDNGRGIEHEYQERIFVMFKTITGFGRSESTGIGLAIVKKIVELHGGKIWVESELGQGATFYFSISKVLP